MPGQGAGGEPEAVLAALEGLSQLLEIIEDAVDSLADQRRWRLHPVGALDLLPSATAAKLKAAEEATRDVDGGRFAPTVRPVTFDLREFSKDPVAANRSLEEVLDGR